MNNKNYNIYHQRVQGTCVSSFIYYTYVYFYSSCLRARTGESIVISVLHKGIQEKVVQYPDLNSFGKLTLYSFYGLD